MDSLKSSSEEDEITATGAAETGKKKLAIVSGVQRFQVKLFKIIFLGNSSYDGSLILGFSQPGESSSKADASLKGGATKDSHSDAGSISQVQYQLIVEHSV